MTSNGNTVLITGGTKGIGFATALRLANHGYRVVLTGRSQPACDDAARTITAQAGTQVVGMALDLASLTSIRAFARSFLATDVPLQVLINNAGQMSLDQALHATQDGLESTLATNAFGPLLLTQLLLDALRRSTPARIVNVSSRVHMPGSSMRGGDVSWDWDNLRGEKSYDPVVFYKNSKLAMMWLTYELNRRLATSGITVNAVCPGFVPETLAEHRTGISRLLYKHVMPHVPGARSVAQAAANTVFAAIDPAYASKGGVFIGEQQEIPSSEESYDEAKATRFWKLACELTGAPEAAPTS